LSPQLSDLLSSEGVFDIVALLNLPFSEERQIFVSSQIDEITLSQRSFLPPQISFVARLLRDLVLATATAGYIFRDAHSVELALAENWQRSGNENAKALRLCLEPVPLLYGAEIEFRTKLVGVAFYMSKFPVSSFFIFSAVVLSTVAAFVGIVAIMYTLVSSWRNKEAPGESNYEASEDSHLD
jgi:hypothetical protein